MPGVTRAFLTWRPPFSRDRVGAVRRRFDNETTLSWLLSGLAGMTGATAFTHSSGYFVTFMTGNTERSVLGYFSGTPHLALASTALIAAFLAGVVVASLLRRHLWKRHAHGATVVTTVALVLATMFDLELNGWTGRDVTFTPIALISFGMGALNVSFVRNGEVSIPLSYVTGTLVKLGQGIERHISGGTVFEWLGYAIVYVSFIVGAFVGGLLALATSGAQLLLATTAVCAVISGYTYFHVDRAQVEVA
ncbi:YoaK family protein [Kutzneria sp. NPDC051319]|uniref:YoaK family protein n=1 Tax=Kutzneria sp. NPDC051319 TaxID=3155047 RepID=UPI003439F6E0